MTFTEKLRRAVSGSNSVLCVGLDPVPGLIPKPLADKFSNSPDLVLEFCTRVIEATKNHVCAFKPNTAFFEALGSRGWEILDQTVQQIPKEKIVIADAKRGDIGNTAAQYKKAFFDDLNADAITLNALMGMDTLDPFIDDDAKAAYILTMTSNRGSADFLQRRFEGRMSLGEYIAEELEKKQDKSKTHLGMVVGATQIESIGPVINVNPEAHLLIPGIGKQGGSVEALQMVLEGHIGIPVINSSRSILYAGSDHEDWEEIIEQKASEMKMSLQELTKRYV
ncbi:orotidine-5'-phosphate decarboxylase [Rhodohalobacter sulfatireducens]|uniref:Orotidine-5'-phosphate decarboxylase n=1 Tax=Rhodohalobacter sulfatireducens TaxID=2911366 RepID=A0ABS9K9P2_9BACT|nr:orotidine-5'-phosphate decarboxylase [Rhodohalobacter sulfatireducens]MCG2587578.1 orotidine-5'-phosphate decarboxylase [Rhodohalobacter sulfatireducens]